MQKDGADHHHKFGKDGEARTSICPAITLMLMSKSSLLKLEHALLLGLVSLDRRERQAFF